MTVAAQPNHPGSSTTQPDEDPSRVSAAESTEERSGRWRTVRQSPAVWNDVTGEILALFAHPADADRAVTAINATEPPTRNEEDAGLADLRGSTASPFVWAALLEARRERDEVRAKLVAQQGRAEAHERERDAALAEVERLRAFPDCFEMDHEGRIAELTRQLHAALPALPVAHARRSSYPGGGVTAALVGEEANSWWLSRDTAAKQVAIGLAVVREFDQMAAEAADTSSDETCSHTLIWNGQHVCVESGLHETHSDGTGLRWRHTDDRAARTSEEQDRG